MVDGRSPSAISHPPSAICHLLFAICYLLLAACAAAPTPRSSVRLTLVGADSMQWLAQSLADAYSQRQPHVKFTVQAANSEVGLRAAREISGTIGLVARAVTPAELGQARAVVIARDGVAVIVNRANPVNAIMRSQIAEIFSGQILVWPVGPGAGKPIVVVSREEGSGTRHAFEAMVMGSLRVTRTAVVMPGEAAMVDYIARNPEAIGYASMGALSPEVRALIVDDVPLTPQTVENKQYPLVRTLALIMPQAASAEAQDFVVFALSAEGQRIVGQRFGRAP